MAEFCAKCFIEKIEPNARMSNIELSKNKDWCEGCGAYDYVVLGTKTNKDWTGNSNSIYKTLGASNHTDKEREVNDFYATEPKAAELLLSLETFSKNIWECACGGGRSLRGLCAARL